MIIYKYIQNIYYDKIHITMIYTTIRCIYYKIYTTIRYLYYKIYTMIRYILQNIYYDNIHITKYIL